MESPRACSAAVIPGSAIASSVQLRIARVPSRSAIPATIPAA